MIDRRLRQDDSTDLLKLAACAGQHEREQRAIGASDAANHAEPRSVLDAETEDWSRGCQADLSTTGGGVADTPASRAVQADADSGCEGIAEYLLRIDRGEQIDRERFIAEHPRDADELRQYFADLDSLDARLRPTPLAFGPAGSDSLPASIGRYRIDGLLGQGGMGRVLKAMHPRMKRAVALKVLSPKVVPTPEALQRFQREVEAAARLTHPNIVIAYDADEADGTHFLVMEYVEGSDLSSLVKKHGPLSASQALDCILQAARGLQYAHEHGVVHRDVKPSNLLRDEQGTVKILDLGLARIDSLRGEQDGLTGTGQIMGTIDFMSPEQAKNTKNVDARADIYSLGATLWYLLTGRPLYPEKTLVEKFKSHLSKPIPSLRSVCPEASQQLDDLFHRMVAKTPDARYQTMAELIADLEPLCSEAFTRPSSEMHKPEAASTSNPIVQSNAFWDGWRDWRLLTAVGAGGLLLILLGVWVIIRDKDGRETARLQASTAGSVTIVTPQGDDEHRDLQAPTVTEMAKPPDAPASLPAWNLPADGPPPAIAPFDAAQAKAHQQAWADYLGVEVEFENSIGMRFVLIPPGEFDMGSTEAEVAKLLAQAKATNQPSWYIGRLPWEAPKHRVRITNPFYLAASEVTQTQYERVMGSNPSKFKEDANCPVEMVNWGEASAFCLKLGELEEERSGQSEYRLPTEAEWEYSCRAGTATTWHSGDDESGLKEIAWYSENAGGKTHPVCQKTPNAWGLYDMHGNVWEWCQDWWEVDYYETLPLNDPTGPAKGSHRVYRGGCWSRGAPFGRASNRGWDHPGRRDVLRGFRVARAVPLPEEEVTAPQNILAEPPDSEERPSKEPSEIAWPSSAKPAPPWTLPAGSPSPAVAPFDAAKAKDHQAAWAEYLGVQVETENSLGMKFVLIPPGEFERGSTEDEVERLLEQARVRGLGSRYVNRLPAETPKRPVRITKPFSLACYETTRGNFRRFVEASRYQTEAETSGKGSYGWVEDKWRIDPRFVWNRELNEARPDDHPVTNVTWSDAMAFCEWLSELEGRKYRLPTEAQWEYACRAGTSTMWYSGDDEAGLRDHAWFGDRSQRCSHPVGGLRPNAWGLYDMHGNVWEWCEDWFAIPYYGTSPQEDPTGPAMSDAKGYRGGSWFGDPTTCRAAFRNRYPPGSMMRRGDNHGFRVVCNISDGRSVASVQPSPSEPRP